MILQKVSMGSQNIKRLLLLLLLGLWSNLAQVMNSVGLVYRLYSNINPSINMSMKILDQSVWFVHRTTFETILPQ